MFDRFSRLLFAFVPLILWVIPLQIHADSAVWTGTAGDFLWSSGANWNPAVAPGATTGIANTDTATFNTSAGGTITIDAGRNIKNVFITTSGTTFTIGGAGANGGEALHLTSGGELSLQLNSAQTVTINAPLILEGATTTTAGTYTIANRTFAVDTSNAATPTTTATTPKLNIAGSISGGSTTSTVTLTLAGTVGTRNAGSIADALNQANTISGVISNGGAAGGLGITVTGTTTNNSARYNAWNLTGLNTFSGPVNVTAGVLYFNSIGNIGQASALGTGTNGTITVGNFLIYTGGAATTDRTFTGTGGSFHNNGTGALTLNGAITTTGGLNFRGSQNFIVNGQIGGNNGILNNGSLTTFLNNNANNFSGGIIIYDGYISTSSIANSGTASGIGSGTSIALGQDGNSLVGTLVYTGGTASTNREFRLQNANATGGGNGRIQNNSTGILTLTGGIRNSNATATNESKIDLSGTGNGIITGVIGGTVAAPTAVTATKLTKSGTGIWELRAANIYSGVTSIEAGTLLVTNTTGSATGTGNVITSGTATLGGNGIITAAAGGSINIASGTTLRIGTTHGLAAGVSDVMGNVSAASQLTLGSAANVAVTLSGNLQFDLFGNEAGTTLTEIDRLKINTTSTGNMVLTGGTVTIADQSGTANWRSTGGTGFTSGTWQIFDWSGAASAVKVGSFTYTMPTASLGIGYEWNTSDVMAGGTISVSKIADANIHIWTGAAGASWNTAGNWTANSTPNSTKDVIFDSNATTTTTTVSNTIVRNILFTGGANYTVNSESGVLYVDGDTINGATIQSQGGIQTINTELRIGETTTNLNFINTATPAGSTNSLIFNGIVVANDWGIPAGELKVLTVSGIGNTYISQLARRHSVYDMALVKTGTGVLTIGGSHSSDAGTNATGTITGSTTINQGTIRINQERALGGNPTAFNAGHLTLNGGTLSAYATFAIDDTNRGVTLGTNGGTFNTEGAFILTIANVVTGSGSLTKTGATGTLILSAANTYTGNTLINEGTLNIANITGSATGLGSVIIAGANNAMLSGSGTVAGKAAGEITLMSGGTLRIGNNHNSTSGSASVMTLGSNANVSLSLNGTLQFDIFSNQTGTPISESDRLILQTTAANINIAGGIISVASPVTSGTWASGTWQLIDWSGIGSATKTGNFTFDFTNATNRLATGFTWNTDNFLTNGTISIVSGSGAHVWLGGTDGSWKTPGNWLAGTVPTSSNDVVFQGATPNLITSLNGDQSFRNIFFTGEANYTINSGSGGVITAYGDTFKVEGGTQTLNAQLRPSGGGTYNIINDGILNIADQIMATSGVNVVFDGTGTTTMSNVSRRGGFAVNVVKNGSGTLTYTSYNTKDGDNLGYDGNGGYIKGTLTVNAGIVRINDERNLGGDPDAFNAAQITVNGGTLSAYADVTIDDSNRGVTLGANGGTLKAEGASNFTIANVITGGGNLDKIGTGRLTLTAANIYTGNTTVSEGALFANNSSGSATGSGSVDVTGTVGGTGSISGGGSSITVQSGGTLIVGNTHGVAGTKQDFELGNSTSVTAVSINLQGTLQFDIFGAGSTAALGDTSYNSVSNSAVNNDLLEIFTTGSLNLSGARVQVSALNTSSWGEGHTWKLIDWSNASLASIDTSGLSLATDSINGYYLTQHIQADGYYITASTTAIPEPSRSLLFMVAGICLLGQRWRKI